MVKQTSVTFGFLVGGAVLAIAGGGGTGNTGGGGGGVTPAGLAEVRTLNEKIPAGGTVQVKYLLTQPRPITGGGPKLITYGFDVNGVSVTSALGDAAGVALAHDGVLDVQVTSPNSDFGMNLDYPFLTVAMTIPGSTKTGAQFPLGFADAAFQMLAGPLTLTDPKPGTLTIGGSVSIHGAIPGGGTWPAGTIIRVQGTGFVPGTKLLTKMRIGTPVYVSSTEMRFILIQDTTLDSQPITAQNPDGSVATFYSYLRGVPVNVPSRRLLGHAEPIFQTLTHAAAILDPLPNLGAGQFMALAVQNPNPWPVAVLLYHQQSCTIVSVVIPSGGRLMDELGALFNGMNLNSGDVISVTSTSAVQILGITGDEVANTLKPWLPSF